MFEHVRKVGRLLHKKHLAYLLVQVRPGHYLIVDTDTGHLEQRQYWDLDYPDKVRFTEK